MSGRPSSVRLRSALGKMDPADNTSLYSSNASTITITEKSSRSSRRTNGHHSLVNGGYNNGNGGSTATRSQSRTRGTSSSGSGLGVSIMEPMEVDDGDENDLGTMDPPEPPVEADPVTSVNNSSASDSKSNNGGTGDSSGNSTSKGVASSGNNNNNSSTNSNVNNNESSKAAADCSTTGADSNSMEVEESSSDSNSSDSSDSSDSEDSSEMDEQSAEVRKGDYTSDLTCMDRQFTYLRELFYQERMTQITSKLEEVRSGKAREYLGPLSELQENMRTRMEVTASLRQFRVINVQHKIEAEELAIEQNYNSGKKLVYDSIKTELQEKIRRLEEDRNNDFTSELWLETALKRKKNSKSLDLFGDKKKKQVTVSGPYLVYMLNDVDIVEDWTVIKKALATPKRKQIEMVY